MISKIGFAFFLVISFMDCYSQASNSTFKLCTKYVIIDSIIEFTVSIANEADDSIGIYSNDPFNYCSKQAEPNCYFIQKKINEVYFNLYPDGTSQHGYSDISYLQKGKKQKFNITLPIKKGLSPFESGSYSIIFKLTYLSKGEERNIFSEPLHFKID